MAEKRRTSEDRKRERKQQKKKTKSPILKWFKRIFFTIVILGILGCIGGAALFLSYVKDAPALDEKLLRDPVSSEFYDKNGELFAKLGEENRTYIKYEDIPQRMIDAITATEDVRFFEHGGLDVWRLGGAVVANIRDGFGAQGASTITQQVVKNSFLQNEKKLKRKAQEAWLAIQLEREYSKEEIFEMYFNKVLMSGNIYGFGTAAKEFYGKDLVDLSLDEMAVLAGIPQSPNNYNPYLKPESAEKRRNIVLHLMVQHGKISQLQADSAKQVGITDGLIPEDERVAKKTTKYPAFLSAVISEINENGDQGALAEGIKVYTTLDPAAQTQVEETINNAYNFPTEDIQSGIAVIDTKTGEIRAVGGGRNYGGDLLFNRSKDIKRSPGSTLKPITAYGPAIDYLKWSTGQTLVDERYAYPGTNQIINNWDGAYKGAMTTRYALYSSRNVPAVKAINEVGLDNALKFANSLGMNAEYLTQSDALGGGQIHTNPVQLAGAYAAFGNNGVYNTPHTVTKIVYRDGITEKSYEKDPEVAMSDYTAYMVTDMLRDVVSSKEGASGTAAAVSGVDIAGKTGTTNYGSDEFAKHNYVNTAVPDAWFAGYTTDYSIAIWSGYDDRQIPITTWEERRLPQTLFKTIMTKLVSGNPPATFKQPDSVTSATIEVGSNPLKLAGPYTPNNLKQTELFVRGNAPTAVSDKYKAPDIDKPSGLSASYDPDTKSISVTWGHNTPEGESASFDVSVSGAASIQETTSSTSFTIANAEPGETYSISVVAIVNEVKSGAASISYTPPKEEEVEEEPAEPTEPEENIEDGPAVEPPVEEPAPTENPVEPVTPTTPEQNQNPNESQSNTGAPPAPVDRQNSNN